MNASMKFGVIETSAVGQTEIWALSEFPASNIEASKTTILGENCHGGHWGLKILRKS